MKRSSSESAGKPSRRSPCPIACSLDVFGDRWTLLIVRDLMLGSERFKEFAGSPEGVPTNILADRLNRLIESGIADKVVAADGSRHAAYRLTDKGRALIPVLGAIRDWGLAWEEGTKVRLEAKRQGRPLSV